MHAKGKLWVGWVCKMKKTEQESSNWTEWVSCRSLGRRLEADNSTTKTFAFALQTIP